MIINNIGKNCEWEYLTSTALLLENYFIDDDIDYVFTVWDKPYEQTPNRKRIVFVTSDEQVKEDDISETDANAILVFKQHLPNKIERRKNLYAMPLGPHAGFESYPRIPLAERKFDYFWSGCYNPAREPLRRALEEYQRINPNGVIRWYEGWNNGMDIEEYSYHMRRSRITFAPPGYISADSFRLYEAWAAGTVACFPSILESRWYLSRYARGPLSIDYSAITASSISNMVNDPNLEALSRDLSRHYKVAMSPLALAEFVSNKYWDHLYGII